MTSTAHDIGASVGAWNAVIRRARIGRERKSGCLIVSSYARADGTKIHCGVSRLAVDMEVSYSTARRQLAWMREVGLIELVRPGNRRRNHSDEYRLVLGPDALERIEVLDPATYKELSEGIRSANKEGQRERRGRADQRAAMVSADPRSAEDDQRPSGVSAKASDQRSNEARSALTLDEPPSTKTISQGRSFSQVTDDEEVRTELALVEPIEPEEPPQSVVVEIRPGASSEPPYRPPPKKTSFAQQNLAAASARRAAAIAAHRAAKEAT